MVEVMAITPVSAKAQNKLSSIYMTDAALTRGQLERTLAQRLQGMYREKVGKPPKKIMCQFFDKRLAIVLEEVATPSEQFLIENDQDDVAKAFRSNLDEALRPQLIALIEEVVATHVEALMFDTDLETGFSGVTVVLSDYPPVRDLETIPKTRRNRSEDPQSESDSP
jgi:uncharacterized protein YbcI